MQKYISLNCYIEKEWSVLYPNAHLAYINNNTVGLCYLEHQDQGYHGHICVCPSDPLL